MAMQCMRLEPGILHGPSSRHIEDTQTQITSSHDRRVHLLWVHARTHWRTPQALVARGLSQSRRACWSDNSKPRFTVPMVFNPLPPMFLRWLRPLLAFTWMDMLGINLDYGSRRISHSTSKMTLCKSLQDMSIVQKRSLNLQFSMMSITMMLVFEEDFKITHAD